jgi:hypothetical protein
MLEDAVKIYLLGFGFGTRNVERLALDKLNPVEYIGTAYGLTQREAARCRELCGNRISLATEFDCLGFLRNLASLQA